ncbi:MAG: Multicopper oxidase type 3, partial [Marmoricola sp.]|nr:Multicopper oxidase type 3 [Marmoricola sp.]
GAVQDEDVAYNNAGTWSVYFDGTSKGLTPANLDLDAFDVP